MFLYNVTFFTSPAMEQRLLDFLRGEFRRAVESADEARVRLLAKVEGAPAAADGETVSVSMQIAVGSLEALERWQHSGLQPSLALLDRRFGRDVLHFDTLLRTLEL